MWLVYLLTSDRSPSECTLLLVDVCVLVSPYRCYSSFVHPTDAPNAIGGFHERCDNYDETLVIATHSQTGRVFGGFAGGSWEGSGHDGIAYDSFLMELGPVPRRWQWQDGGALNKNPTYWPYFGSYSAELSMGDAGGPLGAGLGAQCGAGSTYATETNQPCGVGAGEWGSTQMEAFYRCGEGSNNGPCPWEPALEVAPSDDLMLVAVGSASDGQDGFAELNGAMNVETFELDDGSMYAIVTSLVDNGVQLIDITDPSTPVAMAIANDGQEGFDMLNTAAGVKTFQITGSSSVYAIVTAVADDGVQLIDISHPAVPVAVGTAMDGQDGFTELNDPYHVDTFGIGEATYAIVTAWEDDGVQLIDISDPAAPVAKGAVTDGNDFPELDGAFGVKTFQIPGDVYSMYAIVTAINDDGVQLLDITDPANPLAMGSATDGADGFTELDGPRGVDTFEIGEAMYAIVCAEYDDGMQLIDITNPAVPVAVGTAERYDDRMYQLDGPMRTKTFAMEGSMYAIVTAVNSHGVQLIDVSDPSAPVGAGHAEDDSSAGMTMLYTARGVDTFVQGSSMFAVVTSENHDGLQFIELRPSSNTTFGAATLGVAQLAGVTQAMLEAEAPGTHGDWTT